MLKTFLGVVDRLGARGGRPARLRPLFQASTDRTRWLALDEEFPNCGLVSWWQPSHEASGSSAWYFHTEPSPTYSSNNPHHDYYRVKGTPTQAFELIDVPRAHDLEELRSYLVDEGLPSSSSITRKMVFRDGPGSLIGPFELAIRDQRFFIDGKNLEAPITVNHPDSDLHLVNWEGHQFLPLEGWQKKVGEADFSLDATFLKRIIRELKDLDPSIIEKAKLTDRLITTYCAAIENSNLSVLQKQRLKRLHKLSQQSSIGISLAEEAVPDLLSLSPVKDLLAKVGEEAAQDALKTHRLTTEDLEVSRKDKIQQIGSLETRIQQLRDEISFEEEKLKGSLSSVDHRLQQKLQDITHDAYSFLANIAIVRAALGIGQNSRTNEGMSSITDSPDKTTLGPTEIISSTCKSLERVGLVPQLGNAFLASWSAGFAPIMYGARSREAIAALSRCIFGGKLCWATLSPVLTSSNDVMKLPLVSTLGTGTIEDLASVARQSKGLFLLVFDHINLCQLDSVLLPLLRSHAICQGETLSSAQTLAYGCSSATLPSNVLLAGLIIDSPMALPMSREMWAYTTLIDLSKPGFSVKMNETAHNEVTSAVSRDVWENWKCSLAGEASSDTVLLAAHMARNLDLTSLSRQMVRQLASAIECIDVALSEQLKAKMFVEIALLPNVLSQGQDPHLVMRNMPVDLSGETFIERVTGLFEKWGIYSTID